MIITYAVFLPSSAGEQGTKEAKEMLNSDEHSKLVKAAESLGIESEGLSDQQLKDAISKATSKSGN